MVKLEREHGLAARRAAHNQDEATVSSRLHNPAAACVRKRAARRRRTGRSFDQLLQSGDAAAAACAEYLACGPLQAGAGNQKGDQEAGQEPAGLLPDTPPKPAGQPRLLLSCQSTRVLLSPRSRGTLSSDAAAAQAGGNGLGDSKDMEAVAAPTGVVAAPPAAAAPLAAAPPAAALQEQQLAREIELQLAQQARQAQQAQQLLQEVELQLALQAQQTQQAQQASLEMQLAREAQVAWLVQQAQQAQQAQQVQHALQAQQQQAVQAQQALLMQQAQQATWGAPPAPLGSPTHVLPNVWVVHCGGTPAPQQPARAVPLAVCLSMSPRSGFTPQPASLSPAAAPQLPHSCFAQPFELLQASGVASLTPPSSPAPCGASLSIYNAASGSSPFAASRPGLGGAGDGQPGTPRLAPPPPSPCQLAPGGPERPMRPPPPAELAWLLSQLPPASPLAGTGLQPPGDMNARWQDAASLVAALPASQAQPLLQPVEPLPPPPPLPNARMLQLNSPGQLPCAVPGGCGGPLDAASLDAAALEAVLELPSGLDAQIPDQMLLPFLDDSLLDLIDW